jgi:hypothetical protein
MGEWTSVQLVSPWAVGLDADAPGVATMANASFFSHVPLEQNVEPQPRPTPEDLVGAGFLSGLAGNGGFEDGATGNISAGVPSWGVWGGSGWHHDDAGRVIGTKAVKDPYFVSDLCLEYPGHVIVGLDARDGKVAVDGWSKLSRHDVIDMAQIFERDGVEAIVYTDISRDGMMQGVNIEATVELARAVSIPVIASGGISSLTDIRALCEVRQEGIMGAIIGRALYEGDIDLAEAQRWVDEFIR